MCFASEHYAVLQLAGDYSDNVIVQIIENSPTAEIPDSCLAKGPFDNFEDFGKRNNWCQSSLNIK